MRIPRIYQAVALASDMLIELDETAIRHTLQVLRLKPGAPLVIFNGLGGEYQATLETVDKKQARVRIGAHSDKQTESSLHIHLALGMSKGDRMDYGIQKAVELGVSEITPLISERCVVQLDNKREQKRLQHWQGIIRSACEQCGRNCLPTLHPVSDYQAWLQQRNNSPTFVLAPDATSSLDAQHITENSIKLLIGPEGGLSEAELTAAENAGCTCIRLGPRILRTETAVVAAMSAVQWKWGDLKE